MKKYPAIIPREQVERFESSHDVIVCGYGGAGAAAALEAERNGAEVLLIERASDGGGSTAMSSCEMYLGGSGGTSLQKACGFEDSTENMIAYVKQALEEKGDDEKIRAYCEGAADHFEWIQSLGVKYRQAALLERVVVPQSDESLLFTGNERCAPFTDVASPVPRGHVPSHHGDEGGKLFFEVIRSRVQESSITTLCDARVTSLIRNEEGKICGVSAVVDNRPRHCEARRGVVLTMGGFVMNEEMVKKHLPGPHQFAAPYGNPWDMGDGIRLGQAAGANAINMDEAFFGVYFYPPAQLTYGIFVNTDGQRFVNEDSYGARIGHFCSQQSGQQVYLLVQNEDFARSMYVNELPLKGVGDSIEEVEREAGMPQGALCETVRRYNQFAAERQDRDFRKHPDWLKPIDKPPFALIDYSFSEQHSPDFSDKPGPVMFTLGGLETLPSGEVLDASKRPIPGLFAAGRTTAGLPRTGKGYASGMSVGDATFFGRRAGRSAAAA